MNSDSYSTPPYDEYPPKADLRNDVSKPLPKGLPGLVDPNSMSGDTLTAAASAVVNDLNEALSSNNVGELESCFYAEQAYWRDMVALTSHFRTFTQPRIVAAALLKLIGLRGLEGKIELVGEPPFVVVSPDLMFINCEISFRTRTPPLICAGQLILLPTKSDQSDESVCWKIWVMSTRVENLTKHPEDDALLRNPGRDLSGEDIIETDVCIVGAGHSGLMAAARLKTMGVESVVLDRNAKVGDNWANRYDSMNIHIPTSSCEMPYIRYRKELQHPHLLNKHDIAEHLHRFASEFHLNTIMSADIQSTVFSQSEKKWTTKLKTADGLETKTIVSKHLVQATGLGSGKPYIPSIDNEHLYQGVSMHSTQYRNAENLAEKGVKSVAIIGSANTAFDVMRDCYNAGLKTTMVARSPTYIIPYEYLMDPRGFGAWEVMPLETADKMMNTFPLGIDGQLAHGLLAFLASQEPDRYLALSKAGFPVIDSRDPSANLHHHLLERAGGHYVDVGGTDLIIDDKVAIRSFVEPVGYIETGIRLSDDSTLHVDAVIWCTGFADKDVRKTAREILGTEEITVKGQNVLGSKDIAERLDATWGVDAEGEIRGLGKRHLRMENYWVIGGAFMHGRWWSRALAQQIKLALEGGLPPAYRDTPGSQE